MGSRTGGSDGSDGVSERHDRLRQLRLDPRGNGNLRGSGCAQGRNRTADTRIFSPRVKGRKVPTSQANRLKGSALCSQCASCPGGARSENALGVTSKLVTPSRQLSVARRCNPDLSQVRPGRSDVDRHAATVDRTDDHGLAAVTTLGSAGHSQRSPFLPSLARLVRDPLDSIFDVVSIEASYDSERKPGSSNPGSEELALFRPFPFGRCLTSAVTSATRDAAVGPRGSC
jgi:hypothetical protein